MKVKAIVYSSHAGHTEAYAQMLSAELGVPVFPLGSCTAPKGSEIVYLGWLRAGKAVGLKKACKRYHVEAVGIVGMSAHDEGRVSQMKRREGIGADVYCFYLPGGFELEKTHGFNHFLMRIISHAAKGNLNRKTDKSPSDMELLEMFSEGKSLVGQENILQVVQHIGSL